MNQRIVLCSPGTLFAVLAVIRQAMDSFRLQERSDQLLTIISALGGEWAKYSGKILSLQKQHKTLSNTLDELAGPRLNKLELQFKRVADLTTEDEPAMLVLPGGAESDEP
jgi:DNA recombination protein RmuC